MISHTRDILRDLLSGLVDPVLDVELSMLPPSVNQSYKIVRVGTAYRLGGSPEKKAFEKEAGKALLMLGEPPVLPRNDAYTLVLAFYSPDIVNKTYGERRGTRTRWASKDSTNMVKIIEDVLAEYLNLDDAAFTSHIVLKRVGQLGTRITLYRTPE